jgi:hypothetical protein
LERISLKNITRIAVNKNISKLLIIFLMTLLMISSATGNDSAAEKTPLGGLRFKKMNHISIEQEDLFISKNKLKSQ